MMTAQAPDPRTLAYRYSIDRKHLDSSLRGYTLEEQAVNVAESFAGTDYPDASVSDVVVSRYGSTFEVELTLVLECEHGYDSPFLCPTC